MLQERILSIAKLTSATLPVMEVLGGIIIGSFVIYAAWQTIENGQTPGEFTAFITAFLMAYQPAERLSKVWVELQKSIVQAEKMYEILDAPAIDTTNRTKTIEGTQSNVRFENVEFHYTKNKGVLSDINFEVQHGERIAVVGRSGAGKSTLIDLLSGFYTPTEGTIRIADTDLSEVTIDGLTRSISLITQDVFLFDATIRENIRDGNPDATDEEIEEAAHLAQLDSVLEGMADGIDTRVGPNGKRLSGGQKQRVGIARALCKKAKVYIFDEATSALDVENERFIMEHIVNGLKDSTVIFVTHRPTTLNYVDRVMMLDEGRIVGFDKHETLEKENEEYQTLFALAMEEDSPTSGTKNENGYVPDIDDVLD